MGRVIVFCCFLCVALLCVSCLRDEFFVSSDAEVIAKVDFNSEVSFFDLFQELEVIPLETSPESIISGITFGRILMYNGLFYIHDPDRMILSIFRTDGSFVRMVDRRGNGPGEYVYLGDFNVNPFTCNLELLNPMGYLHVYDSLGIRHIKTIRLHQFFRSVDHVASLSADIRVFMRLSMNK